MKHAPENTRTKFDRAASRTLGTITRETCTLSSRSLWAKAKVASTLRHEAIRRHDMTAARVLAEIKLRAIRRAVELAPQMYEVSIDSEYQIGLVSVRANDGSRLHLPAAVRTDTWEMERYGPRAAVEGNVA